MTHLKENILSASKTITKMAVHDLRARYAGSGLGLIWSIAQPLALALILWLIIGYGMRTGQTGGIPTLLWLLPGMAAWNFFAEGLGTATSVLSEYAFLVKKMNFTVAFLPPVKIFAALLTHLMFLGLVIIILLIKRVEPSWQWLLLPYYGFSLTILLIGLSWITSALNALARDTGQIVNILLQFGFWLTPVFWSPDLISKPFLRQIFTLNPMYYITDGYRKCLVLSHGRENLFASAIIFWIITIFLLCAGRWIFTRLQPHFADTL